MRRALIGTAAAVAVAAVAAIGQMLLARWLRVLVPDQDYTAGNDTWPFQLVLLAWYAATAAVLGCAVARRVVWRARWRWSLAAPAGLGALVALRAAQDWAAGASAIGDAAVAAAAGAVLLGAVVGVAAGVAVLAWRSMARGTVVWVAWVWLTVLVAVATDEDRRPGRDHVVPVDPLGVLPPRPRWLGHGAYVEVVALLSPLALCAFLGWWAGRRGDRLPLLGAMAGPLLLVAVHGVVPELPTGRSDGDHYSLAADLSMWLLVTVLGVGAGALGAFAGGRRRTGQRAGEPAAPAVMLLMVVASLLAAAALFSVWSSRGGWLDAGAACLALGAGLALYRRAALSALAGACAAAAGVAGLAVLAGVLGDRSPPLGVLPSIVGSLVLAVLIGAFARGARGAAWFAVAAGALHVVAPLTESVTSRRVVSVGNGYAAMSAVLGLLVIGAAVAVLTTLRNNPVALSAEGKTPRTGQ
jgi:hypothetical protein